MRTAFTRFRCDRCASEREHSSNQMQPAPAKWAVIQDVTGKHLDLCPSCADAFDKWRFNKKGGNYAT